jgi:hypothetical protein
VIEISSVRSAIRQLNWHVTHTQRYVVHQAENMRLEAQHGLSDDPDWHLSGSSMEAAQTYSKLLRQEFEELTKSVADCELKQPVLRTLKRRLRATRRALKVEHTAGTLHPTTSPLYARSELLEVILLVLTDKLRIPQMYRHWNNVRFNRWFLHDYIPDVDALNGHVYRLSHVCRLVLYEDRLQVRWMTGEVLENISYDDVTAIRRIRRREKERWTFVGRGGQESCVDVSGVWNRQALESELLLKCPQVSAIDA